MLFGRLTSVSPRNAGVHVFYVADMFDQFVWRQ